MMTFAVPIGLFLMMIGGLIAVNVKLAKRPTFRNTDETYTRKDVCSEVHRRVDEKLKCIPDIDKKLTKICTILEERNKKEG